MCVCAVCMRSKVANRCWRAAAAREEPARNELSPGGTKYRLVAISYSVCISEIDFVFFLRGYYTLL